MTDFQKHAIDLALYKITNSVLSIFSLSAPELVTGGGCITPDCSGSLCDIRDDTIFAAVELLQKLFKCGLIFAGVPLFPFLAM